MALDAKAYDKNTLDNLIISCDPHIPIEGKSNYYFSIAEKALKRCHPVAEYFLRVVLTINPQHTQALSELTKIQNLEKKTLAKSAGRSSEYCTNTI